MRNDAWTIGLVATAHAISHFFQLALAPLFPLIREELAISYSTLGLVVMMFYAVSAVLQPFAGFVVDRYGGRGVLISGVALMTLGAATMSFATGTAMLALGAVISGAGNSVFHPADFSILNGRVSPPRLGYAFSAHSVAGSLGFAAAPVFSAAIAAFYGWHAALLATAAVGVAVLALLLANAPLLGVMQLEKKQPVVQSGRVLLAWPVLVCFLFFTVWGASYAGLQNFGIAAMTEQYGVSSTLASSALTAYMIGSGAGMLAGGFVAARIARHDLIAGSGLAMAALIVLAVASGAVPGPALPLALGLAGIAAGVTYPSRDLMVRASTPPGAAGRVYGFVYSGLDVGSLATPVLYGMMIDRGLPQGVFYAVFALTLLAILTVLQLPGRRPVTQRI